MPKPPYAPFTPHRIKCSNPPCAPFTPQANLGAMSSQQHTEEVPEECTGRQNYTTNAVGTSRTRGSRWHARTAVRGHRPRWMWAAPNARGGRGTARGRARRPMIAVTNSTRARGRRPRAEAWGRWRPAASSSCEGVRLRRRGGDVMRQLPPDLQSRLRSATTAGGGVRVQQHRRGGDEGVGGDRPGLEDVRHRVRQRPRG